MPINYGETPHRKASDAIHLSVKKKRRARKTHESTFWVWVVCVYPFSPSSDQTLFDEAFMAMGNSFLFT